MLHQTFQSFISEYSPHKSLQEELWQEIEKNYSGRKRHYHTLEHLENILVQLNEVKAEISDWSAVLFTLYYHDIIYNSAKSNNEEKSAQLAVKRMQQLSVNESVIQRCNRHILATKTHVFSDDSDTNYFTDADLSVLGQDWDSYSAYYRNVRKEYSIYPDLMYKSGRKKVLAHFLEMDRIFKTDYFYSKFEEQAKENLKREIGLL